MCCINDCNGVLVRLVMLRELIGNRPDVSPIGITIISLLYSQLRGQVNYVRLKGLGQERSMAFPG